MIAGPNPAFWRGKRVLVTGHTGFKGGWLTIWLNSMGAETHGFALSPPSEPSLFQAATVANGMTISTIGDIRDPALVKDALARARPEVVFHLAAQPLVRSSYDRPVDTFEINVMGLVHVLEAVRATSGIKALVNVTTDKCYENKEWSWGYREHDPLGGSDPYSSSKACAELVTAAYRRSYLGRAGVSVATARAGNVIGGGDWATDRLLPDVFRALDAHTTLSIRSPEATRPWQHVLEPVSGYLMLAERLHTEGEAFAESWNFGPAEGDERTVRWIVEHLVSQRTGMAWDLDAGPHPHEMHSLKLDSSKARARLGWRPRWRLATALGKTSEWHDAWRAGHDMRALTLTQIDEYSRHDG
ncbi:MAG TPA: CDP-glucose 4,6-dehydratase [Vicinamibacterales bacterium]|jgi:CDP-glucose 4,6-dehydratase|nr:CDP-glucose 4,6-dehydratase [Vicinamibacterales bacterium]